MKKAEKRKLERVEDPPLMDLDAEFEIMYPEITSMEDYLGGRIASQITRIIYRRYKKPRANLRELLVREKKLLDLSKAETEKYKDVVFHLTGQRPKTGKISIDVEGFSMEVAEELGMNYLKENYVIVSLGQKECDSSLEEDSFSGNMIRNFLGKYSTEVEHLLIGEALIGEVSTRLASLVDQADLTSILTSMREDPESVFNLKMEFDTASGAVGKLKRSNTGDARLKDDMDLIKNKGFLEDLLELKEEIKEKHGSLDRMAGITELAVDHEEDCFKLSFGDIEFYCIRSKRANRREYQIKTPIFVYFDEGDLDVNRVTRRYAILNGNDPKNVDRLVDLSLFGFDVELGLAKVKRIINSVWREKLRTYVKDNPDLTSSSAREIIRAMGEAEEMPQKAKEIFKAVKYMAEHGEEWEYFKKLGPMKIHMVYPKYSSRLVYEMISRMEKNRTLSFYRDTKKFIKTASSIGEEALAGIVTAVLNEMDYVDQYNPTVNSWLRKNKPELCKKIGIEFVTE